MLRFMIRDLLWLMVVVGLAVGLWLDHRSSSKEIQRLEEIVQFQSDGISGHVIIR
jgi:hypothetical protein